MSSTPQSVVYVSGEHCVVYRFPSQDAVQEWESSVHCLKDKMSEIVTSSSAENWSMDRKAEALEEWFGLFDSFHESFPNCMVPPDVLLASQKASKTLQSAGKLTPSTSSSNPKHSGCERVVRVFP